MMSLLDQTNSDLVKEGKRKVQSLNINLHAQNFSIRPNKLNLIVLDYLRGATKFTIYLQVIL